MPIYEYHCKKCKQEIEVLVRGNEKPACPNCESTILERKMSLTAAPSVGGNSLPVTDPGENCGRPQCGTGFG